MRVRRAKLRSIAPSRVLDPLCFGHRLAGSGVLLTFACYGALPYMGFRVCKNLRAHARGALGKVRCHRDCRGHRGAEPVGIAWRPRPLAGSARQKSPRGGARLRCLGRDALSWRSLSRRSLCDGAGEPPPTSAGAVPVPFPSASAGSGRRGEGVIGAIGSLRLLQRCRRPRGGACGWNGFSLKSFLICRPYQTEASGGRCLGRYPRRSGFLYEARLSSWLSTTIVTVITRRA